MLCKCANPVCSARFRYLQQGRLFEVETKYFETPPTGDPGEARNARGQVEHYWLCDDCAMHIALRFDRERGLVTVSSPGSSSEARVTVIPQSISKVVTGVAQVLIRPSALSFKGNPASKGQMKTRKLLNAA